jgi:hypothetical protein
VVFQLPASLSSASDQRALACTGDAVRATFNAVLAAAQNASSAASISTSAWLSLTSPDYCNVTTSSTGSGRRARQLQTTYYLVITAPVLLPFAASAALVAAYNNINALTSASFSATVQAVANALGNGVLPSAISFLVTNVASECASGSACITIFSPAPTVSVTPTVPATPMMASATAAGSSLTSSQQVGLGVGIALPLAAIVLVAALLARSMAAATPRASRAKAATQLAVVAPAPASAPAAV